MSSYSKLVKIKNTTLLFIIVVILSFSATILYFGIQDKKEHIDEKIALKKTQLELLFTKQVVNLQKIYDKKIENLINNEPNIIDAFASRDRARLDKLVEPYFETLMKDNPNFELICFGLPDSTAFYRAHMPRKFGDDISKVQGVSKVNSTKKDVSGFMVAKLGLYYRLTYPVYKDGKYIGLVAFGVSLNYVNDFIQEKFSTQSAIIVNTKELKKSKWYEMLEEGSVGRYTVISTNGELIEHIPSSVEIDSKNLRLNINNKDYSIINDIKIYNIFDKEVATVILFQDITKELKGYDIYLYSFSVVLFLIIIILIYVLIKTFNKFLSTIIVINDDLKELNSHLEDRVKEEVNKNREKEKQLYEQSKRAQLAEMIGNIAHQWRQPLSVISSTASSVQLQRELGLLNDNEFDKMMDNIVNTTQYLSKVIDDFRNFIEHTSDKSEFIVREQIESTLNMIDATLDSNDIKIIKNFKDKNTVINSVAGEFSQVLLNIINNAQDILIQREIKDKKIFIAVSLLDDKVQITIEDNARGISEDIIDKVFDPYFTTKHQSQGTGIGLYMSSDIVSNTLKGKLYVKNTQKGAKFFIELPLV
ncbi:MAG: cache domain-containing protein [Campylobacterota bacterium]|nr:cache domain-containing protein [Campylobacterota bacterium]